MFTQFLGLSLIIHLLIILSAKMVNFLKKRGERSAFQTYGKNGGIFVSEPINAVLSYVIFIVVGLYMFLLAGVAVMTALRIGENEPHRRLFSYLYEQVATGVLLHPMFIFNSAMVVFIISLIFMYERVAGTLPVRITNIVVDVCYNAILKVVVTIVDASKTASRRVTGALGTAHAQTIGRPFAISAHAVIVRVVLGVVVSMIVFGLPLLASAQIVEPGFESELVVDGFTLATAIDFTPDGRIFVAEKSGTIRVIKNGALLPAPLVTLSDTNTFGDRGLLGLAVDPNFGDNGYIYVSYTFENTPGLNIAGSKTGKIARLTVVGDTADESSKLVLVGSVGGDALNPSCEDFVVTADCIASDSNSHSVGGLRFGPDGKLYATLGDGADFSDVDPRALRAQNVDALAGKMLRINTDGTAPTDNPFYNGNPNANRSKVYALGLRNAFRFNFNTTTGQLYAGDVGWSSWEEVNRITSGANFGWPCREGNVATSYGCTPSSTATNPLYTYPHNASGAGSITGGSFASNNAYPDAYDTSFFIGDYAQMWMKRLVLNAAGTAVVSVQDFIPQDVWPVEVHTGPDGNVYYLDIVLGSLNRLTHTSGNRRPIVAISANPTSGLAPLAVSFSSAGTSDPDGNPITYAWNFDDGSVATTPNATHTYTVNGSYGVTLTVTDSNGAAVTKSTPILVGNQAPSASITSPASGSLYTELQTLTVTGNATDPETGVLPASAYTWNVILHHNVHTHTLQTITGTKTISFPADAHNASDVYIEVILNVTDPAGLTDSQSINLYLNNGIGSGNLVSNASLEVEGAVPTSPLDWYQGWFGVMDPIFTYPVAGLEGTRAARIQVQSYTSGTAKWFFTPAFVTPGSQYTFTNLYTATVGTSLVAQFGRADGTFQYQFLTSLPATTTPKRTSVTFTVPAGIETATIFHEIGAVGQLTVDSYTLALAGADAVAPAGNITAPLNNTTVSGITPITVNATDNVGVASVQLFVDGVLSGVPDSEAPYTIQWNTTTVTNGTHTLTARILDTSANAFVTPGVNVTVSNATSSPVNLFNNGDFEIVNGANPQSWQPGGTGTHTAVYSYPVPGFTGNGIAINVTKYDLNDTGDARWVHAPIPVQSGIRYTYETMYKASTVTDVLGRYRFANGTEHYFGLIKEIPGTITWTKTSNSFVPPVGAVDVTFGHAISAGGATLTIDDVKLFVSGTGTPSEINVPTIDFISPLNGATLSGTVTLTATSSDDTAVVGVFFAVNGSPIGIEDVTAPYQAILDTTTYPNGTYILKATTRDPYGNNDNKTITVTINNSATSTTNLVPNGTFETAGTAGNPASWNRGGWGTNTRTYTYPATGFAGNGAQVTVSGYTSGDAKWYFTPVVITPGTLYTISDRYNGTIGTEVLAQFTRTDGTFQYQYLGATPATGGLWQTFNTTLTPPAGVNAVTLFHVIAGNGTLTIDNMSILGPGSTTTDTAKPFVAIIAPVASSTLTRSGINLVASSTDNVAVAGVKFYVDGVQVGNETLPREVQNSEYFSIWDNSSTTIGSHTIFAVARDNAGNTATSTPITIFIRNGGTVTITSPTSSSAVSGVVSLTANVVDSVATQKVHFNVSQSESPKFVADDLSAPYSVSWDTRTVPNGVYSVNSTVWDVLGGVCCGTSIDITVSNTTSPSGTNLVPNGTFETAGTAGNPASWNRGGWGTNTRTYTYPATGFAGNGATVAISGYTNGDAKWFFNDVAVTPGTQYTVSDRYNSTVASEALIRYTLTGGTNQYLFLQTLPSSAGAWQTFTGTFTPPANTVSMTLFHLIAGNGSLTIDNMSVTGPGSTPSDTTNPTATVTAPTAGATLTGTTTVSVTATDNVAVTSVSLLVDGNVVGSPDTTAPYSFALNTVTLTNGGHTISARASDAIGNLGTSPLVSVTVSNGTGTPDTTIPTTAITTPAGGIVSGSVTVNATAADNIAVASVTLLVDGAVVGVPDTTAPYSFTWDTTAIPNGIHTLTTRALDTSNNIGTGTAVTVTVQNGTTTPPSGNNLILNADLEIAGTGGNPAGWNRGGWGTNNRTFTYPVAGQTGNGAQITMTSYTSGDAKWFFDDIAVTPGTQYSFGYNYLSTITTNISIRYTMGDGSTSWVGVANPSASPAWTTGSFSFVPPAGAVSATVVHILGGVGSLTIDNQSLTTGNTHTFSRGKLTFSFDDGWLEHYTTALPVLDAAGIDGTFYIITDEMQNANQLERVDNSSLETAGISGSPLNWNQGGWGTNNRTFTYPVAGQTGNGAEITITSYTDGDAKWYFDSIPVTPDAQYTVGDNYKSTVATILLARYTMVDDSFSYVLVNSLPSTGGVWAHTEKNITVPSEATAMTLFHLISGVGSLTVDDVSVKPQHLYANQSQVGALFNSGHEIGTHTRTHPSLPTLTLAEKQNEITGSRQVLVDAGFGPVTSIAYPYGDFDAQVQQVAQASGLTLGRSVLRGYNDSATEPYALMIQQIGRNHTLAEMQGWIDHAAESNTWLILMFHQINNDVNSSLGITEADFTALVDYAKTANVDHITVAEGAALLQ